MSDPSFTLETLVDFVDDALTTRTTMTRAHVESFMDEMKAHGIRRVIWGYYGDGHGGWLAPGGVESLIDRGLIADDQNAWGACLRTYRELGNPLRVACEAAHARGMEVYAYFKPYETGPAMEFAAGSPEALEWGRIARVGAYLTWLDPFVLERPELRLKRRTDDLWPGYDTSPVRAIKLYKKDASPTRVRKDHLALWASDRNYGYHRLDVPSGGTFSDEVVPNPRDVFDTYGNLITKKGEPVRVLTLGGLDLTQPYIAVTAAFEDGEADFENAWDRLVVPIDERGRELPVVYGTGTAIWFPELERFPDGGLMFETGRGPEVVALDRPRKGGRGPASDQHFAGEQKPVRGVVAFARGKNLYLSGGLCETEPAVQDYWLKCVAECLDAGVDGVEFRVENHSCHSEEPAAYGFNDVVLAKVSRISNDLLADIAKVRTEAYTDFLRRANRIIKSRGKKMRVNLNMDWFRPPHERPGSRKLAYPANIDFPWQQWIDEGLLDEGMLRPFAKPFDGIFGEDAVAQEMIRRCRERDIPLTVNRYVWGGEHVPGDLRRVRDDGRFAGFVLYETWSFTTVLPDGRWVFSDSKRDAQLAANNSTWKTRLQTAEWVKKACESLVR